MGEKKTEENVHANFLLHRLPNLTSDSIKLLLTFGPQLLFAKCHYGISATSRGVRGYKIDLALLMCTCFYTLANVISISNMSMLHQCQFDELASSVGSLCLLATLSKPARVVGYSKMSPPLFLQSTLLKKTPLFATSLGFLHNPIRQKKKQSDHFHITFSSTLRPSPLLHPHGEADADADESR